MKSLRNFIAQVVEPVLVGGAKQATKFVSPNFTIKATFQGKRRNGASRATVIVTAGRPNYRERQFIKDCKRAGVSFPVKKVRIKGFPARKGR